MLDMLDIYEKSRTKTYQEVWDQLVAELVNRGLMRLMDNMGIDVLVRMSDGQHGPIPDHRWISCYAVTGASEGWYVHVDAVGHPEMNGRMISYPLFRGKTFEGMEAAYKVALACADILGA